MGGTTSIASRGGLAGFVVIGCLLLLGGSGSAYAQANRDGSPRAVLLVHAVDDASQADASRLFSIWRKSLVESSGLEYRELDNLLSKPPSVSADWERARELVARGRKAYDNLELDQAIRLCRKALKALESDLGRPMDAALYTEILTYLGASILLTGNERGGRKVFGRLLMFDPAFALDPVVFPPSLAEAAKQEGKKAARRPEGRLRVESEPAGAEVFLDEKPVGLSPVSLSTVKRGPHLLRLVRRGYASAGKFVNVAAKPVRAKLTLKPLKGLARLDSITASLSVEAERVTYPQGAEQLIAWAEADRLFFVLVERRRAFIDVLAFQYDGLASHRISAQKKTFEAIGADLETQAGLFFTGLLLKADAQTLAGDVNVDPVDGVGGSDPDPVGIEPESDESVWTSWWLWTVVGVVVGAGAGVALGLTLGGGGVSDSADVIFRF